MVASARRMSLLSKPRLVAQVTNVLVLLWHVRSAQGPMASLYDVRVHRPMSPSGPMDSLGRHGMFSHDPSALLWDRSVVAAMAWMQKMFRKHRVHEAEPKELA